MNGTTAASKVRWKHFFNSGCNVHIERNASAQPARQAMPAFHRILFHLGFFLDLFIAVMSLRIVFKSR